MRVKESGLSHIKGAGLAAALVLGLGAAAWAQQSMEERRDKKLKEPFLAKAAWITDYDKALEESKKSGKLIFGYFTRSYAP
jgi:hypothetical protein